MSHWGEERGPSHAHWSHERGPQVACEGGQSCRLQGFFFFFYDYVCTFGARAEPPAGTAEREAERG